MRLATRIVTWGRLIRFSHTVFALPFAVMGALLAARGLPSLRTLLLVLLAMVGARSAAMAMNRLADHALDARNPRTAGRELPAGVLSRGEVTLLLLLSVVIFLVACALLNRLCLLLSPIALFVLLTYPFAKRFTSLCHLWLGAALGLAPVGAFVAVRGAFDEGYLAAIALGGAVVLWTAGFDIIYALLDEDFDRKSGVFSLPARLGRSRALLVSALFHVGTVALLLIAGIAGRLDVGWYAGVAVTSVLLLYEHAIVRPDDLSRVNTAFFTMNGMVSLLLMAFLLVDVLV